MHSQFGDVQVIQGLSYWDQWRASISWKGGDIELVKVHIKK